MKKFGLILPDSKKKKVASSTGVNNTASGVNNSKRDVASIFNDDSEEEELAELRKKQSQESKVTRSISTSDHIVSQLHEEALKEDPNVFDYDAALETDSKMNSSQHRNSRVYNVFSSTSSSTVSESSKEPKYMQNILAKAEERKIESELIKLRNMKRKSAAEGTNKVDGEAEEVFVTSAYKQRLQELEEKEKELKERQKNEEEGDVTKRKDMSGFYYNLMKRNVSFGGVKGDNKKIKTENESKVDVVVEPEDLQEQVKDLRNESIQNNAEDEPVVFGPRRPPIKKKE